MISNLATLLILIGLIIHLATLSPLRKLIAMLPLGSLRNKWYVMAGLIFIFITGYLGYVAMLWGRDLGWDGLLVPCILLFGAIFVWSTIALSLQTTIDLRRIDVLEGENVTDPLTKIYNRRYMDRRLEEEAARSKRYAHKLSILMLDIDHFKQINDTYGHQAGDTILHSFASMINSDLRDVDIVARYGGEEFLVICTSTDIHGASLVAERIRRLIESHQFQIFNNFGKSQILKITASIGVSDFNMHIDSKDKMIHAADQALYQAKREGRNRVVISIDDKNSSGAI